MVTETVLLPQKPQWSVWSRNKQFHICIQTCSFSHCSWPYPAADRPPSGCRFLSDGGSATHLAFHSGALYSQPPGICGERCPCVSHPSGLTPGHVSWVSLIQTQAGTWLFSPAATHTSQSHSLDNTWSFPHEPCWWAPASPHFGLRAGCPTPSASLPMCGSSGTKSWRLENHSLPRS